MEHKWNIETPFTLFFKTIQNYSFVYKFVVIAMMLYFILVLFGGVDFVVNVFTGVHDMKTSIQNEMKHYPVWMYIYNFLSVIILNIFFPLYVVYRVLFYPILIYLVLKNMIFLGVNDIKKQLLPFVSKFLLGHIVTIPFSILSYYALNNPDNLTSVYNVFSNLYFTSGSFILSYFCGDYMINAWNYRENGYPETITVKQEEPIENKEIIDGKVYYKDSLSTPFIMVSKTLHTYSKVYRIMGILCYVYLAKTGIALVSVLTCGALFGPLLVIIGMIPYPVILFVIFKVYQNRKNITLQWKGWLARLLIGMVILLPLIGMVILSPFVYGIFSVLYNIKLFHSSLYVSWIAPCVIAYSYGDYAINLWNYRKNGYPKPYEKRVKQ